MCVRSRSFAYEVNEKHSDFLSQTHARVSRVISWLESCIAQGWVENWVVKSKVDQFKALKWACHRHLLQEDSAEN